MCCVLTHPTNQRPCFVNTVATGSCNLTDAGTLSACLCTSDALLTDVAGCVRLACDVPDQVRKYLPPLRPL